MTGESWCSDQFLALREKHREFSSSHILVFCCYFPPIYCFSLRTHSMQFHKVFHLQFDHLEVWKHLEGFSLHRY
ncbi:hypothetical protein Y032_0116g577 [Ancylostoma ceylanicum]|uniref:Uncharacterized protein n=1 Tax=Ancylostoma ceylanicum TaxID=53326 RepID=A0A016TCJ9_9BILA|nr:hypothetical protein Y032_0116g577 [Ancylostoma ceylanicum]